MLKILDQYLRKIEYRRRIATKNILYRLFPSKKSQIVHDFHKLYYDSHVWHSTQFLGIPTQKCPFDLFIYQEIIHEIKPDYIIEAGTAFGGGALFLATICESVGKGKVLTIDITKQGNPPKHPRIEYIIGSSTSQEVIEKVANKIRGSKKVMVILDSDHSKAHVLKELYEYNKFVTKGSYLIVEDTNVNSHPVYPEHGLGPMEALDEFLESNKEFVIDSTREKFLISFNPRGYLKRIA